jgi:hypothetical protein
VILAGTTPAAADDDGGVDPALGPLLATGPAREVGVAMLHARMLVPVVAARGQADAHMAVPALVNDDGRRALPVFSSYDALRAWRADARPVPMSGARALAAAADEGYDGVVLDVAGPHPHTLTGPDLAVLAEAAAAVLAHPSAAVAHRC